MPKRGVRNPSRPTRSPFFDRRRRDPSQERPCSGLVHAIRLICIFFFQNRVMLPAIHPEAIPRGIRGPRPGPRRPFPPPGKGKVHHHHHHPRPPPDALLRGPRAGRHAGCHVPPPRRPRRRPRPGPPSLTRKPGPIGHGVPSGSRFQGQGILQGDGTRCSKEGPEGHSALGRKVGGLGAAEGSSRGSSVFPETPSLGLQVCAVGNSLTPADSPFPPAPFGHIKKSKIQRRVVPPSFPLGIACHSPLVDLKRISPPPAEYGGPQYSILVPKPNPLLREEFINTSNFEQHKPTNQNIKYIWALISFPSKNTPINRSAIVFSPT